MQQMLKLKVRLLGLLEGINDTKIIAKIFLLIETLVFKQIHASCFVLISKVIMMYPLSSKKCDACIRLVSLL